MPSGIKLKWTGKKCWKFAQKNNVNKREKAGSFIHKPIYSSKASVAAQKKKNTLNLLNSTIQRQWVSRATTLPCVIRVIFRIFSSLRCASSLPLRLWRRERGIAERWRSQRGSAPACECSSASLGSPSSVCVCPFPCRCVCVQICSSCVHASVSKPVCVCVCDVCVYLQHPPQVLCEWSDF